MSRSEQRVMFTKAERDSVAVHMDAMWYITHGETNNNVVRVDYVVR